MNVPKVFVGTLHCGEGDFELCCEMIASQSGVVVEHHVISNLPELEAHNALWNAWNQRKKDFQLFVKVDADTVLKHNEVLFSFWKMIKENPQITGIQAPLHDYFTDSFINGLNCFTPEVEFKRSQDSLYCDRNVDVNHRLVIKADGVSAALRPAGLHCHSSTEIQAFHYGLHRMLKKQTETIAKLKAAHAKYSDRIRSIAIKGAESAKAFSDHAGFNYNDLRLIDAYNKSCL